MDNPLSKPIQPLYIPVIRTASTFLLFASIKHLDDNTGGKVRDPSVFNYCRSWARSKLHFAINKNGARPGLIIKSYQLPYCIRRCRIYKRARSSLSVSLLHYKIFSHLFTNKHYTSLTISTSLYFAIQYNSLLSIGIT